MRKLSENMLRKFFGKHMDKAGTYAVQDLDDNFVEKIYGDYSRLLVFLTKSLPQN
jgi:septum formation protein